MSISARAAARIHRRVRRFACIAVGLACLVPAAHAASESISYRFTSGADGFEPAQLVRGNDGNFYGSSHHAPNVQGVAGGIVFRLTLAGALTTLAVFPDNEVGQLIKGSDGNFYGMTSDEGPGKPGILFKLTPAGTLTTLHTFTSADGTDSGSALVQGSDGNFYGGGDGGAHQWYGTIFRFNPVTGVVTTLHSFDGSDGATPGALVDGGDGSIYGTTVFGGADDAGTFFKVTPAGNVVTLHQFDDHGHAEGAAVTGLVRATDGNFYGTTLAGGGSGGAGTIFKLTPAGTLSVMHTFHFSDPPGPFGLMQASDGNFYGSLFYAGANRVGTVYRMNAAGAVVKLYAFGSAANDGTYPDGVLVEGADGNLYGTTASGGGGTSYGTVYRIGDLAGDALAVSPDFAEPLLLTTQCIAASVFDRNNIVRPNVPIGFLRSGANPGSASTSADGAGVATHCWSGPNAGYDQLTASSGAVADKAIIHWNQRHLSMVAKGYIEALPLQQKVTILAAARLSDDITGAPVAGRAVQFLANGKLLCSAMTAGDGTAECKATAAQDRQAIAGLGYTAVFQGDAAYFSNSAAGSLACVGKNCVP